MPHAIVGTYLPCKIIPWFSEMEQLLMSGLGYFEVLGLVLFFSFLCIFILFSAKSCNVRQGDKEGSWKIHLRRPRRQRDWTGH